MELLLFLAACGGGYWVWKQHSASKKKERSVIVRNEFSHVIDQLSRACNNTEEKMFHIEVTTTLIDFIRHMDHIRPGASLVVGSFAHAYLSAALNGDKQYTANANIYISKSIRGCKTRQESSQFIAFFLTHPQPNGAEFVPGNFDSHRPVVPNQNNTTQITSQKHENTSPLEAVRLNLIATLTTKDISQSVKNKHTSLSKDEIASIVVDTIAMLRNNTLRMNLSHSSSDSDHANFTKELVHCILSIEDIAAESITTISDSSWEHYSMALLEGDFYYIKQFNKLAISTIGDNGSLEDYILFIKELIHQRPKSRLNYILQNKGMRFYEYYNQVMSEIKRIDSNNVIDGTHWIELTEDDDIKVAFQDCVDPKQLAQHIVTYSKLPLS